MQTLVRKLFAAIFVLRLATQCFSQDLHWGESSEGFELALGLEKTNFQSGEAIIATVVLKNVSDKVRSPVQSSPPGASYGFYISHDPNDPKPSLALPTWSSAGGPTSMAPNISETNTIRLDKVADFSQPGMYFVKARRGVPPVSKTGFATLWEQLPVHSGIAVIHVLESRSESSSNASSSSAQSSVTQRPARNIATNNAARNPANPNTGGPTKNSPAPGIPPSVPKSQNGTASPSLPHAVQAPETSGFTSAQRIGLGILAAFLALLAFILLRAKARQKRSSS